MIKANCKHCCQTPVYKEKSLDEWLEETFDEDFIEEIKKQHSDALEKLRESQKLREEIREKYGIEK